VRGEVFVSDISLNVKHMNKKKEAAAVMSDQQLDRILKSARLPKRPHPYWTTFSKRLTAAISASEAARQQGGPYKKSKRD
jgi:hypothetical protein